MKKIVEFFKSEILPLLVILLLVTSVRSSLADHYHVPSSSMEYTLMPGDHLVVDKTAYGLRLPYTKIDLIPGKDPAPGEVVIFDSPVEDLLLIKRVVAVEGDVVEVRDGRLWVNGNQVAITAGGDVEKFNEREAFLNLRDGGGPDLGRSRIPKDMLLVLGDHRGNSRDGRYFGLINKKEIYGQALGVFYRKQEGFVWKEL